VVFTALILAADAIIIAGASYLLSRNLLSYYTLLMLLEAAVLLSTGAFKPRTILPVESLKPDVKRDWSLILTGLFVLALSFVLAYPLSWLSP